MTLNSFFLILSSQLRSKWGRFILASGGIMIGVWAITLTTGLSIGLRDTLVQAINSRPEARFLQIYKSEAGGFNFSDVNSLPVFQGMSEQDIAQIRQDNPEVSSATPSVAGTFAFRTDQAEPDYSCSETYYNVNFAEEQAALGAQNPNTAADSAAVPPPQAGPANQLPLDFGQKCLTSFLTLTNFDYLYNVNRANWLGSTDIPTGDEIIICYECDSLRLGERLGFDNPEDMVGTTIGMEVLEAPDQYVLGGEEFDILNGTGQPRGIAQSEVKEFTVKAVVDDREPGLSIGFSNVFLPRDYFDEAIKLANPEAQNSEPLFVEYSLFVDDFSDLEVVTDRINETNGFFAQAIVLFLISAINNVFIGLTVVLSMLGFIAFVASVFGIITVMFISVLERKKEIGILKSLGARNVDIFFQFLLESFSLGVVGWIFGMLLAWLTALVIQASVFTAISNIESLREGLAVLSIDGFSPAFPWWIFPITFGLAVFFTSVSGIVPAFSAARQNPVDVLRSE